MTPLCLQLEERVQATYYEDSGLVFATAKGTPLDAQNIVNRYFKPLLRQAGLPDIRWHDLRHTYATLLLSRGTHPTYVQKSLGHASVQLTLDRYSHWMPSMGRNTADGTRRWARRPALPLRLLSVVGQGAATETRGLAA
jgi:integrase